MKRRFAPVILLLAVNVQVVNADYFVNSGAMNYARYNHTATVLANGKILVVGGIGTTGGLSCAELYDAAGGVWTNTGSLLTPREEHTATLLFNGKVLVTGGYALNDIGLTNSCELYDEANQAWSLTGMMNTPRALHTATLLQNGKVLVTGGWVGYANVNGPVIATAEIFDTVSGVWTSAGSMTNSRTDHTATLLNNGKVLIAGGSTLGGSNTNSVEIYDPATGIWTSTGKMKKSRRGHSATLLQNGLVLVAGGTTDGTISAELFDPNAGIWTYAAAMLHTRAYHTATLLTNGFVLVAGGYVNGNATSYAELYDPWNNVWIPTGSLLQARGDFASVLLTNGYPMATGGKQNPPYDIFSSTEIYVPGALPTITSQPQSTAVTNGHFASFAVTATGVSPLSYQWCCNGTNIPNKTNTTLEIQNAFPTSVGFYTAVVISSYGSVTSNPAFLTVLPLYIITPSIRADGQFQFGFDTATGVNYSVECSTNLTQWFPIMTLGGVGLPVSVIDPNAVSSRQRFYRVGLSAQ